MAGEKRAAVAGADLLAELSKLSKEQLIQRLLQKSTATTGHTKKRKVRPFDFSAYGSQHVAMKVAYLGWNMHGYASQLSFKETAEHPDMSAMSRLPTVEEYLFRALMQARLIEAPATAKYSRCGRTDAGVSATGQVIGLTIRSSKKKTTAETVEADNDLFPVATMINSLLPPEIRVLQVVPAPEGFSARFDCRHRLYHYYFPRRSLDIAAMQEAASQLVGEHDFRNFCKRDPSKIIQNYRRTILEARIESVDDTDVAVGPISMYRFVIKGTAFLYHQVRCTMALLFMVGEGKASRDTIPYLLETLDETWRPTFQMASEIPLVLVECAFDKVTFTDQPSTADPFCNSGAAERNQRHWFGMWKDRQAQTLTLRSLLQPDQLTGDCEPPSKVHINLRKPE